MDAALSEREGLHQVLAREKQRAPVGLMLGGGVWGGIEKKQLAGGSASGCYALIMFDDVI